MTTSSGASDETPQLEHQGAYDSPYLRLKNWLHSRWGIQFFRNGGPHGLDLKLDLKRLGQAEPRMIFDVGANVGQSAERFMRLFPQAKIHSFEPVGDTFRILQRRMAQQPNVAAHSLAFSDRIGDAEINLSRMSVLASLEDNFELNRGRFSGERERVRLQTLSRWCADQGINHIDLLKVDTEGHDLHVLRGAANMLERQAISAILVEIHFLSGDFENLRTIQRFLDTYGYRLVAIHDQEIYDSASPPLFFANCLFVAR
jgi:FkbM family methyltransferase